MEAGSQSDGGNRLTWALEARMVAPREAKAAQRSGWRWTVVRMAEAERTPDAATPHAMLSARFPIPTKPI